MIIKNPHILDIGDLVDKFYPDIGSSFTEIGLVLEKDDKSISILYFKTNQMFRYFFNINYDCQFELLK